MKAIQAGTIEAYDLAAIPAKRNNLGSGANLPAGMRKSLDDYPIPSTAARAPASLDEDARRRLASLGYVSATAAPVVRPDAPRPADMTRLIAVIEKASALFAAGEYAAAIPLLRADPRRRRQQSRRDAAPRRRRTRSLGHEPAAMDAVPPRRRLAPDSARRPHLSRRCTTRAPSRRAGGAAARACRRGVAAASRRSKDWPRFASGRAGPRRRSRSISRCRPCGR